MEYVYVIMGSVGEYSDHRIWTVAAVDYRTTAKIFVQGCKRDGHRIMKLYNDDIEEGNNIFWYGNNYPSIPENIKWDGMYDKNMWIPSYTGYKYWYEKVEKV